MDPPARNRFVRPRVRCVAPNATGTWLLEDVIRERLGRGETGVLWISGRQGSGLHSALDYLRATFADEPRVEIDPTTRIVARSADWNHERATLRVCGTRRAGHSQPVFELAPWTRDEWIEYLLARHPTACAGVMERLAAPEKCLQLGGVPLLWAGLLDELAADRKLPDDFEALRAAFARACGSGELLGKARAVAFASLQSGKQRDLSAVETQELLSCAGWLRQEPVLLLLAAEAIVLLLAKGRGKRLPTCAPDPELLRVIHPLLARDPGAREEARRALLDGASEVQPWAASLVHLESAEAFRAAWSSRASPRKEPTSLAGAQLVNVQATGLDLAGIDGVAVFLSGACLDRADLTEATLWDARLSRATLRDARMCEADMQRADLYQADLARADARGVRLDGACLDGANLGAADLRGAVLEKCSLRGTSFEGADLSGAHLRGLDFRGASSMPARLSKAALSRSNLEGQSAREPDFSNADLDGALLSGTRFPGANFRQTRLRNAGLAWIDWEGANLFDADLTGASFHLGSSRSGLVLNAPAGWGTRTGFYTDEYKEQGFKAPEEIRKANLRRADLRKAKILETDFYLVDLRGALYTPDQEKHLRGCGAILGS